MPKNTITKDDIVDAALTLAQDLGWNFVTMNDIASEVGITLSELRAHIDCKSDILMTVGRRIDRMTLDNVERDPENSQREDLFDVLMERFDALNNHRAGVIAVLKSFKLDPKQAVISLPHLGMSMAWMLEAAGHETQGIKGAIKVAGLSALYLKTVKVWMDDESPDMAKTMAALDQSLMHAERWANTLGF
jgi:AcrR family transcriptional regulator